MKECRTAVRSDDVLQHVSMQVDDVDGRRAARTNVGQQWVPKKLCKRTQVDNVDGRQVAHRDVASGKGGRHTACRNVGQPCIAMRFCNTYPHRSPMLTAD